jgi:hypothetical protein
VLARRPRGTAAAAAAVAGLTLVACTWKYGRSRPLS